LGERGYLDSLDLAVWVGLGEERAAGSSDPARTGIKGALDPAGTRKEGALELVVQLGLGEEEPLDLAIELELE